MAVQVKCVVDDSQQHTGAYGLLGECDVDYFVGKPRKDGDDWLCDISYDPDLYVAKFKWLHRNITTHKGRSFLRIRNQDAATLTA